MSETSDMEAEFRTTIYSYLMGQTLMREEVARVAAAELATVLDRQVRWHARNLPAPPTPEPGA